MPRRVLGRAPGDFVSKRDTGKNRTWAEFELLCLLVADADADDDGGKHGRGNLAVLKGASEGISQQMSQRRHQRQLNHIGLAPVSVRGEVAHAGQQCLCTPRVKRDVSRKCKPGFCNLAWAEMKFGPQDEELEYNAQKRCMPSERLGMGKGLWTGRSGVRRAFLLIILAAVLYYVGRILEPFFPALAWAAILATVFFPAYQWMLRYVRRRELASGVTCLLLTVAIVFPVLLLVFLMARESVKAYGVLGHLISSGMPAEMAAIQRSAVYKEIGEEFSKMGLPQPDIGVAVMRAVRAGSRFLIEHSASLLSGFLDFLLQLFVMLLSLYYLFLHGPQILRELLSLIPLRPEYEEELVQKFQDVVQATFRGNLGAALIQGVLGALGFLIFGLPTPLLLGAAMALASLVPAIGSALIWAPVAIFYLLTGSVLKGVFILLVFGGVAASVDNLVKPFLVQRGVEIRTLWVFVSVVGGLSVFGFLGVVLGPFLFVILVVLVEIYKAEFRSAASEKTSS